LADIAGIGLLISDAAPTNDLAVILQQKNVTLLTNLVLRPLKAKAPLDI
jgi:hypothetical protein